jgi:hypothetical protein
MACTCHPNYVENINRRIVSRPSIKARPYLKSNHSKKGWEHGQTMPQVLQKEAGLGEKKSSLTDIIAKTQYIKKT